MSSLNHLLFKCEVEEKDIDPKRGPYGFEKKGKLKYAGIASFIYYLKKLKVSGRDMSDEIF